MGRIVNYLRNHLIDSTALLAESTPVYSAFEVGIAGMSYDVSINARLIAAGSAYGGVGSALTKGRDLWRKMFNVSDTTSERVQMLHDTAYLAVFNLVTAPAIYYASGSRDLKEIAIGTACSIAFGSVNGTPLGYVIDTFRDFTGIKKNDRIPNSLESLADTLDRTSLIAPRFGYLADKARSAADTVRKLKPRKKKGLAALLTAGAIALTAGIYSLTPNRQETQPTTQEVQIVSPIGEDSE